MYDSGARNVMEMDNSDGTRTQDLFGNAARVVVRPRLDGGRSRAPVISLGRENDYAI